MRSLLIASLLVTGFAHAAEQLPPRPAVGDAALQTPLAATTEVRALLARVDAWQQAHRVAAVRPLAEARWMLAVYAAYRVTGEATYLERLGDWTGRSSATLPIATEASASLLAALPLIRYNRISTDSKKGPDPAAWKSWWTTLSQPPVHSARMIAGLATLAALGADTPTSKMEVRVAWFKALNQYLAEALPALVEPKTGLIGSAGSLADQGEVLVGLASVLDDLPRRDEQWKRWADIARTLSTALIQRQGSQGLWAADLGSGTGDVPGSALVVAGLGALLDQELIDGATVGPALHRAWSAIAAGVASDGSLAGRSQTADESGAVMLAAAGMIRLQRLLGANGKPLPASASQLVPACDLSVHPLAAQLQSVIQRSASAAVESTGLKREDYLRTIAKLVGHFRTAQDAEGRIIDLVMKVEFHYATPLYAHAAATLVASGYDRSPELLDSAMRALDASTSELVYISTTKQSERKGKTAPGDNGNTSNFYIRPVMGAYQALQGFAPPERIAVWKSRLSGLEAKNTYQFYEGSHFNWPLVLLWGEFLRNRQGWIPDSAIDHTLNIQRWQMTPLGFYFEYHSPWAYEVFGRYFVVGMLADGYHGSEFDFWRDAAWRGAWSSLLVQAPDGEIPVGGRSAQHIWNEPESAAIWEHYASAYAKAGKSQEAGMFKRAAHLALREANRWIDDQGRPQIAKNWYPPQARHGYMNYSYYATYGLLAASMLSSAWDAAEDGIPERAVPADLGGTLVQVPELNSVIAHADGAYVNYMTRGDQDHDPTGLVRVQLRGVHPQLGPSCGAVDEKVEAIKAPAKTATTIKTAWGISPIWTGADGTQVRFAALRDPSVRVISSQVTADAVSFVTMVEIASPNGPHRVEETIVLGQNQVRVSDHWTTAATGTLAVSYPALTTDGRTATIITVDGPRAELRRPDAGGIAVEITSPTDGRITRTGLAIKQPNGMVEPLLLQGAGDRIEFTITPAK
jgi:hypothetical protein